MIRAGGGTDSEKYMLKKSAGLRDSENTNVPELRLDLDQISESVFIPLKRVLKRVPCKDATYD